MDNQTLFALLALGNLALGIVLWCHTAGRRGRSDLSTTIAARFCQFAGWLLAALPPSGIGVLIALSYIVLSGGLALEAAAFWRLTDWRRAPRIVLGAFVALAALLAACGLLLPGFVRTAGGLPLAIFPLATAAALARGWVGATLLRRVMAIVNVLPALALTGLPAIAILGVLGSTGSMDLDMVLLMNLMPLAFLAALLCNSAGYLLLGRDRLQGELDRLETVDALTDVPNRRGFYQGLAPWLALARRPGMPTAIVILNLDGFKRVNDHYGHGVGDVVLKAIVDAVRRQLREADMIGRLGGAEFALLLPRTGLPEATLVAERVRAAVAALPVKAERAVINLTASMGVTTIRAEDSTVSLFKRADEALQAAKLRGRNSVVAADDAPAPATDAAQARNA